MMRHRIKKGTKEITYLRKNHICEYVANNSNLIFLI